MLLKFATGRLPGPKYFALLPVEKFLANIRPILHLFPGDLLQRKIQFLL